MQRIRLIPVVASQGVAYAFKDLHRNLVPSFASRTLEDCHAVGYGNSVVLVSVEGEHWTLHVCHMALGFEIKEVRIVDGRAIRKGGIYIGELEPGPVPQFVDASLGGRSVLITPEIPFVCRPEFG
jgi:hypothetical protein